jgi:hypothetical protein
MSKLSSAESFTEHRSPDEDRLTRAVAEIESISAQLRLEHAISKIDRVAADLRRQSTSSL